MKLEQALRIMMTTVLSTSFTQSHNDVLSNRKLSSVEDVVGTGCRNTVDFHTRFKTDQGADCVSSAFCDGSAVNNIFIPKAKDVCIKFNEANCNVFEIVTAFDEEWMMKHITLKASVMGATTDPKSITFLASNDSVKWEVLNTAEVKFPDREKQAEFVVSNDSSYKYYSAQFYSDQDIMHLGKYGLVEDYTKACTSQMHEGITGELVPFYATLSPTSTPTDALGHEFNANDELKTAVQSWMSNKPEASIKYGHIQTWRVGKVTSMVKLFQQTAINDDLSLWDTSSVTDMTAMFKVATEFNSNISDWNVSSVTDMLVMFNQAHKFNVDLSDWNVSGVTSTRGMFSYTKAFNCNLSDWNVSSVENMDTMFYEAEAFEQAICWDTSITNADRMFDYAKGGSLNKSC